VVLAALLVRGWQGPAATAVLAAREAWRPIQRVIPVPAVPAGAAPMAELEALVAPPFLVEARPATVVKAEPVGPVVTVALICQW
jgi:hypothetical protein